MAFLPARALLGLSVLSLSLAAAGCEEHAPPAEQEDTASAAAALESPTGRRFADFNGDGFADLAVGVQGDDLVIGGETLLNAGSVQVFYGAGNGLSTSTDQVWTLDSPGVPGEAATNDGFGSALATGDFDGDGFTDLAIGIPHARVPSFQVKFTVPDVGAFVVLYGSPFGLTSSGSSLFTPTRLGLTPTQGDGFASTLVAADFDADGKDDLAIGAPGADMPQGVNAGYVFLLVDGRRSGFGNNLLLTEDIGNGDFFHPRSTAAGDSFGAALAVGDFDANGHDDLAIGVPLGDEGGDTNCGALVVRYFGDAAQEVHTFTQAGWGGWQLPGTREPNDHFAAALAAGDFDGDGYDDLAIGVPMEDWGGNDAGGVNVVYGNSNGLSSSGDEFFSQLAVAVEGAAESGDRFGATLLSADFNGDGRDDLAVGVPGETVGGESEAGAVNVLYGRSGGLSALNDQFWSQDSTGISGAPVEHANFGQALARGDSNHDGIADLIVGVPGDSVGTTTDAGTLHVIRGSGQNGLSSTGVQFLHRQVAGVEDSAGAADGFGIALNGGS